MPHIHERIDYTGDILIVNGDAVLLRMHDKYNKWFQVGGHVELHEDPVEATLREAREETGLEIRLHARKSENLDTEDREGVGEWELSIPRYINRHRVNSTHEHIAFFYFGVAEDRNLKPAEGEQQDGFKWFTKKDLENPTCPVEKRIRKYALAALEELATEV